MATVRSKRRRRHGRHRGKTSVKAVRPTRLWSAKVRPHWHPPEGFFSGSAKEIADGLVSVDPSKAMARLTFYINRAGRNLSAKDRARLERAKTLVHNATT